MGYAIAIDGPAGAGKSTVAKMIAKEMGYIYVDTGAMYRAMAIYIIDHNIDVNDDEALNNMLDDVNISIEYENGAQQVILNGENVTSRLRLEQVGQYASICSTNKNVRLKLVDLQRKLAETANVIMDGRDIGTYVLPNATLKVFLTADARVRAKRRVEELEAKGETCVYEDILATIMERDLRDTTREFAPLKQAEDAILVNTDNHDANGVMDIIINLFKEKIDK